MGDFSVVLVEDDERLAALISEYLQAHEFSVRCFVRGDEVLHQLDDEPDVIILDLMLPGMDGLSLCRALRERYDGPLMMLTAKTADIDQVVGLELGADDYICKPVEPRLLLARIRALLRRVNGSGRQPQREYLQCGALRICIATQTAYKNNEALDLTTQEFELLHILFKAAGTVVSRDTLYRELRGIEYDGLDRTVDVYVSHLRKKLGDDQKRPRLIKTVWGKGYLLAAGQGASA
ncbi:MAG: DNA-binding response regulator [Gammaproteobacteria bacterium]|nr:MAG: DNA-binding response regulator [Gammaproteobacteria bacterium]